MEWLQFGDQDKKRNILSILIKMVKIDGAFSPQEYSYISLLGKRFGMDDVAMEILIKNPVDPMRLPTAEADRMTIMIYLLLLMKADSHISASEERMVYHYGFRLGFREPLIRDYVQVIKHYRFDKLPPDALIKQVKKYLN